MGYETRFCKKAFPVSAALPLRGFGFGRLHPYLQRLTAKNYKAHTKPRMCLIIFRIIAASVAAAANNDYCDQYYDPTALIAEKRIKATHNPSSLLDTYYVARLLCDTRRNKFSL